MSEIIMKIISLIVPLFIIPIFFKVIQPTLPTSSITLPDEIARPTSVQPFIETIINNAEVSDARAKESAEYEEERKKLLEERRKEGPNFAQQYYAYRAVCGAPCGFIYIIDLGTGELLDYKYGFDADFSLESNIISINGPKDGMNFYIDAQGNRIDNEMEIIRYIFKNGRLVEIK